ncbi:MAG: hypothetical protein HY350_02275, partial [Candidatus Omnitrophica bacterium]|nr:hypothetical protein [Candidatus Omnitrophota bacterium]
QPDMNIFWAYADILISTDNGVVYKKIGESKGEKFIFYDTIPGQKYYVKVISVNTADIRADSATAPTVNITVSGTAYTPPDVTGLQIFGQGGVTSFNGRDCKFTWNRRSKKTGAAVLGYGADPLGYSQGHIDPYFMDFEVQILVSGVVKRTEHITDNVYTYSFEKNKEDNGTPQTAFTTRVWQRNIYNQKSANYAELAVSNSAPAQVGGLTADFIGKDLILYWAESSDLDLEYYKVDITGAGGTKTQYIKATRLVYPYDQNVKDHGSVGDPTLTIDVYAKDAYGQVSPVATVAAVNAVPAQLGTISSEGGFRSVSFWWSPSTETDLKHYKIRYKVSTGSWSAWENIKDNVYTRSMSASEISTYGITATIYFEAKAVDVFDQESATTSAANDTAENIKQIQMDGEIFQIKPTDSDSNTVATLKALYDGIFSSGGVTYTISGPTKYLQYEYPVEQIFNKVILWPTATFNCYIAYSADGNTWNYLKSEADHTLDANGKLLEATDQSDAETNYWTTGAPVGTVGIVGLWAYMRQAKYVRLYIKTTVTLYEVKFWTYAVLDEIDAGTLHLAKGLSIASVDDNNNAVLIDTAGLRAYYNSTELGQNRLTKITGEKGLEVLKDGVVQAQIGRLSATEWGMWAIDGGLGGTISAPALDIQSDGIFVISGAKIGVYKGTTPGEIRFGATYGATDYLSIKMLNTDILKIVRGGTLAPTIQIGESGAYIPLDIYGGVTLRSTLDVIGQVTLSTMLDAQSGINCTGTLDVSGISTFASTVVCETYLEIFEFLFLKPAATPGSPLEGYTYYDSSAKKIKFYNGSAWETISSS